jgi:ubiquinone/menaquinone biosynthesis C-methylase UbiE
MFGANFSAPVRDLLLGSYNSRGSPAIPPRVLDVACGNGTWILEMATEFPDSQFYGIDFDPNYPTTVKPSNTFFSQHDVLSPKGLPFSDNYFDYVHMRHVYTCFSESDWTVSY